MHSLVKLSLYRSQLADCQAPPNDKCPLPHISLKRNPRYEFLGDVTAIIVQILLQVD